MTEVSDEKEISCPLFDLRKWIPGFSIDNIKRTALCFRETLVICLKNDSMRDTKPIGCYCSLVESIGPEAREFLVHVQCSWSVDGHFCGSKIISSATSKFHCLEEKRTEFMYKDGLHEKILSIGIEDNFYHLKLTDACPCNKSEETKDLSFRAGSKLISEGVNILLMRYLALTNYSETLSFESLSIDGELIESSYICTPVERIELDEQFLDVYTIERKMQWENGRVCATRTHLTPQGRILRHNWLDLPYILKINPLADLRNPSKTIRIETPLKDRWTEDVEMFSKYLDKKSFETAEQTEYMFDHPEIKEMIADYLSTLLAGNQSLDWRNVVVTLLKQPVNVIDFTIQHFKAFAGDPLTWEETSTLEDDVADVTSQIAEKKSAALCGVCGFNVDCVSSASFVGESCETMSPDDSTKSNYSEGSNETATDIHDEKDNVSTPSNMLENASQLRRICDRCEAIVKDCDKHKCCSKLAGRLKVCAKCSIIDRMLQELKR